MTDDECAARNYEYAVLLRHPLFVLAKDRVYRKVWAEIRRVRSEHDADSNAELINYEIVEAEYGYLLNAYVYLRDIGIRVIASDVVPFVEMQSYSLL
jgi:hypothetical protein